MEQKIHNQEERISRMEQVVDRIEQQVNQLVFEFTSLKDRVEAMLTRLDDHQNILYGEKGKTGLISQGETLHELQQALKGYGREPGLIADIKNLLLKMGEFDEGRKWLTRLIIGAIITDIIVHFIQTTH